VSRAFVKEDQFETDGGEAVPERVQSGLPNYVTPRGLNALAQRVDAMMAARDRAESIEDDDLRRQEVSRIDRDLHYFQSRLESAIPVEASQLPEDHVHFGSEVRVAEEEGREQVFVIVGEDEADPKKGWVSWASPLARALMNARVGDVVTWKRPSGSRDLEVVAIRNARLR
jgi:transcription elongation GreA/GreB family factor